MKTAQNKEPLIELSHQIQRFLLVFIVLFTDGHLLRHFLVDLRFEVHQLFGLKNRSCREKLKR